MTSATLTLGAAMFWVASGALPQALRTSTAANANGIRKVFRFRSMEKTPAI